MISKPYGDGFNATGYDPSLESLKRSPLLRKLSKKEFRALLPSMKVEVFGQDDDHPLTRLDTMGRFYMIISGRLKVYEQNSMVGREITLFLLRQGDVFDVITLLDGQRHEVLYKCLDKQVRCASVPMELARKWVKEIPAFNSAFFPYLGHLLRSLEELAADLSLCDTGTRLAKLILKHADSSSGSGLRLIHDLPHREIAGLIGSVRVVVNRQMQNLKRQGLLGIKRGKLIVRDIELLTKWIEDRWSGK